MTRWALETVLCDLVLAIVINTSAMLLSHAPITFATWYPGTASAFLSNVLIQLVLAVPLIGQVATRSLKNAPWRWVVSVFIENLIFVTCISFVMACIQHGDDPIMNTWLSTYPYLLGIGYVTSLVLFIISKRVFFASSRTKRTGASDQ